MFSFISQLSLILLNTAFNVYEVKIFNHIYQEIGIIVQDIVIIKFY